jgi:GNAT superfamily N-acetyltransferase
LSRRQARSIIFFQDFHFDWEYVSGASNRAADALSRQDVDPIHYTWGSLNLHNDPSKPQNVISNGSINAMVIVNSEMIDQLLSQSAEYPNFASLFANPTGSYRVKDGRLFKDHMLCVPRGPLRDTFMHDHYDAAVSGHRGFAKTLSSIRRSYFWPTLRKDTEGYIKSCDAFQRAKALQQPHGGLIPTHSSANEEMEVMSMDFVFDLPVTSSGKSGIAVIVDKLSRQAHFLSLPPEFDAVDLAHLYIHEFYRHHGLPRVLISDRDVRFTSLFWTALMKRLGVRLNLSTAYHPQTDGQSERTICTLGDVIKPCLFVASKQIETSISNNWNLLTIIVNTPAQIKPRF